MKEKHLFLRMLLIVMIASMFVMVLPMSSSAQEDDLKLYDSNVTFKHFAFELNKDNSLKSFDKNKIVDTQFNTKVIENKFIKVTLLPDYGGRILSIIYKPTEHELLYQNPIGTPYGIGEGNFFYNWLMVYGGIFPTFPEPEHGKTWCLPWETKVIAQDADKISIEMRYTDNIAPLASTPPSFSKGETKITCVATVTVYKNTSYVDYNIKLINNQDKPVGYEYWTCTTFAPGSEPGNTVCPSNTEIIAPVDQVVLKDDWWPWMGTSEKAVDKGNHVFEYKNLAHFSNWADMGIAYASPSVDKGWWGVINHDNEEGILRIANNKQDTPGMKFWTWGDKTSRATDPKTFGNSSRPYIELWAGNSLEFFKNTELPAKGEKAWNEYYMPTAGLSKVTYANKHTAVDMDYTFDKKTNQTEFYANLFTTHPGEALKISLKLKGTKEYTLLDKEFTSDPQTANQFKISMPQASNEDINSTYELTLKSASDETLAQTSIPYITNAKAAINQNQSQKQVTSDENFHMMILLIPLVLVVFIILVIIIWKVREKRSKT